MSDRSAPQVRTLQVRVLGPLTVVDADGREVDVRGPRHRALLARLVVARGRTVPLTTLVEDLWGADLPARPAGAVRTFVAALRAALEPDRAPRTPPRLLVTRGAGYAVELPPEAVDAWCFEAEVRRAPAPDPDDAVLRWERALGRWRGPALAGVDAPWARGERARLTELRLGAVEALARARLDAGRPDEAVGDLDAHTTEHPWREEGWRLLALALYRARRDGDALAVLRRARARFADELGTDPGPALGDLETDILRRAPRLDPPPSPARELWVSVAGQAPGALGTRATLESTTALLRSLAVHGGGPVAALARHAATVEAAEELDDPALTARLLGAFDVPSIWTRSDDPAASAVLVRAAQRCLDRLDAGRVATRARLLATIALETRGLPGPRGHDAALAAETLARGLGDPTVLLHALAARVVQSAHRLGSAPERLELGREILDLATAHEQPTSEILGHLVLLQARSGLGELDVAARHAEVLTALGDRHDSPHVGVFVAWFAAMRAAATGAGDAGDAAARYRDAAARLVGTGMPGVEDGLLALALAGLALLRGDPVDVTDDAGPHAPWLRPHRLLADARVTDAAAAVRELPDPPPGHLADVLWCLAGHAALAVGDDTTAARAAAALAPAAGELAGAGSGMLTAGPVSGHLAVLRGG